MFNQPKVLIADDSSEIRQTISTVLRVQNIVDILTVSNGHEAREAIYNAHKAGSPFNIVFLDWDMPLMPGIDVLTHFREQADFSMTAFIMVTSKSHQNEVLKAVKAGATSYIVKPVVPGVLIKKLTEVLERMKVTTLHASKELPRKH